MSSTSASSSSSSRREALLGGGVALLGGQLLVAKPTEAVQGMTAGRIPGLSGVDSEGFRTYSRPEGKMGGHGIGWSEIPKYQFRVPDGWKEEAVSIADLGGTEIDVRFAKSDEGQLAVVVAPVLRFMNVGFNADVRIEDIGSPDKVLNGFAPEILGGPVEEDDVVNQETMSKKLGGDALTYYIWETKSHDLLSATAFKNRVFIIALRANGRQWRTSKDALHAIQKSFRVDTSRTDFD
ncbi:PsbP domain-containing protein [Chloropicon primus]|nr:PsbP domain-containing protein [Chloropicon primus]UPR00340.1 PsbP domain-containing protein [Chloropicon primus]|eukprot:QDZ21126.1 PsbP domain-containing protein [Chloropicon primus]